ncbi:MAG: DUF4386 domain-containing protein [Thermoanaerobaculia bacterium]
MTRTTNARLAGFTFLFYIAAGITRMILSSRAMSGEGTAAKLESLAGHATELRFIVVLSLLMSLSALVLGVTLWAITREQDPDLAMLAMTCRVVEGVNNASSIPQTLGLFWLATATGANAPDSAAAQALAAYFFREGAGVSATFFAVGSTLFSWLLLRGRMIPVPLAWLGVVASVLLVLLLPLQLAGSVRSFSGAVGWLMWMPMLVFELVFALWLLIKGVAAPAARRSPLNQPSTVS